MSTTIDEGDVPTLSGAPTPAAAPSSTAGATGSSYPLARRPKRRFDLRREAPRLLAIFGTVVVLNLLLWVVFVRPRSESIGLLEDAKLSADKTERKTAEQLAELKKISDHVGGVTGGVQSFYEDMLSTKRGRMVPFQRALDAVGKDFNVRPTRVSVDVEELDQEGIETMAFDFPLQGGYENLRRFLARLEELDQFLIVRQVTLGGGEEGGRALQLNVKVETYFNSPELVKRLAEERARQARSGSRSRTGARR